MKGSHGSWIHTSRHDSLLLLSLSDLNTYTETFTQTHIHTHTYWFTKEKTNQTMKIFYNNFTKSLQLDLQHLCFYARILYPTEINES